jgi:dolichol-phosphate mannosyltransferase
VKALVAIVAFNEAAKLKEQVGRFPVQSRRDVLLVDDGSTDGTAELARQAGIRVISHGRRLGVGRAVRTAVKTALSEAYDVLVIMAGNGKDQPEEVPSLLAKIEEGFDFVIGSRYLPGGSFDNTPLYRIGATKWVHPFVVWLTTGRKLTDTSTGFRAIRTSLFRDPEVDLEQDWLDSYDCEMYILYKAVTLGRKIGEVPARKIYPPHELGYTKMTVAGWWKMLRAFFYLRLGLRR